MFLLEAVNTGLIILFPGVQRGPVVPLNLASLPSAVWEHCTKVKPSQRADKLRIVQQLLVTTNSFPDLQSSLISPHLLRLKCSPLSAFPVSVSHPEEFRFFPGSDSSQLCDLCLRGALQSLSFPRPRPPLPCILPSLSQLLFSRPLSFLCFCRCHLPIVPLGLLQNKLCTRPKPMRFIPRFMFHSFSTDSVTTVAMRKMLCRARARW